jgi:transmembrane sensor
MMLANDRRDQAIEWHVRLNNSYAPAEDWMAFTAWLEADPANVTAYDAIVKQDALLSSILSDAVPNFDLADNDNGTESVPWYRRRIMIAIAASVAITMLATPYFYYRRDIQTFQTKPGEIREIAMQDGSKITMNGGTKILLDRKNNRFAQLDDGEAVFVIRHDAAHPFVLETDSGTLKDLGTIFNVRKDVNGMEIAVADGAVQYQPTSDAITIAAGNKLQVSLNRHAPILSQADRSSVAGWQQRQLTYHGANLRTIALDLSRMLGTPIKVSPKVENRLFSGVIRVGKDEKQVFHRLESLLGIHAHISSEGWLLTS